MRRASLVAAVVVLAGCQTVPHVDPYVPKTRDYVMPASKGAAADDGNAGSLWRPDARNANLFSDERAFREHDLVVVKVEETADAKRSSGASLTRDAEIKAAITAFLNSAGTTTANFAPSLDTTSSRNFKADGSTNRTEHLTATVPAEVKKVLPNGNLFIEGHRVVLVNDEEQHFYISGLIRPIDIGQDNSVRSSYVADAEIEFTGRGVLSDNQKPGAIARFWNWIWPF